TAPTTTAVRTGTQALVGTTDKTGTRKTVTTGGGDTNMKLVFAGTPEVAVPSLKALLASDHEVAAVVTRPDARSGRGRKVSASPVAELAQSKGIEVLKPVKAKDPEFLERLAESAPDRRPGAAHGAPLPRPALSRPQPTRAQTQ